MKTLTIAFAACLALASTAFADTSSKCEKEAAASALHYVNLYVDNGDTATAADVELVRQDQRGDLLDYTFRIQGALYFRTCRVSGDSCRCELDQ